MRLHLLEREADLVFIKDFNYWSKGDRVVGRVYADESTGEISYLFEIYCLKSDTLIPFVEWRDRILEEILE